MFYERLKKLCEKRETTPTTVVKLLGLSSSKVTAWKNGSTPNGDIVSRLARHLDVSTDYLLGNTDDPNQKPGESNVKFDDFSFAFYEECKDLSDEDKQRLLTFARMLKDSIAEEKKINGK